LDQYRFELQNATWGYRNPQTIIAPHESIIQTLQDWNEFIDKVKQRWGQMLQETITRDMKWSLKQLVSIIGFFVKSGVELVRLINQVSYRSYKMF
jgi:hypothetical protein